ncbi:MAG: hypothetical protein IPN42_12990 [Methylococcaceae bacterium]|nr:hypothetical protein [Methylococcaceae bacterium]
MERTTIKTIAYSALTAGILAASQGVFAHTTLQTNRAVEGTRVYNNATIGHGCGGETGSLPVIANSIVFPDGTDSIITIGGVVQEGAILDDYLAWGGKISHIPSRDVFSQTKVNFGRGGEAGENAVGNHSWHGSLPAHGTVGLVPLRINGTFINPDSCANSVKLEVAIADVCKLTGVSGFATPGVVNFWTPFVEGSLFNRADGENEAASFTITRDPANELPETCNGVGVDVVVTPSAAQLNHDMPIPGVWPRRR